MKTAQVSKEYFKQIGVEAGHGRYHEEMVYGLALMYTAMIDAIAAYLKKYNLTPGEMNVLMLVKHQGKDIGLSQVDMGRRLVVSAHNMTRLIQRLEMDGLIKRVVYKDDGRVNLVTITLKGSKLLDEIWPGYDQMVQELAGRLSIKEQKDFSELVHRWLNKV